MHTDCIDRTGPIWSYTPAHHKMAYRQLTRIVAIGPRAQAILAEVWKAGYLFTTRKGTPYNVKVYGRSIARACKRLDLPTGTLINCDTPLPRRSGVFSASNMPNTHLATPTPK